MLSVVAYSRLCFSERQRWRSPILAEVEQRKHPSVGPGCTERRYMHHGIVKGQLSRPGEEVNPTQVDGSDAIVVLVLCRHLVK